MTRETNNTQSGFHRWKPLSKETIFYNPFSWLLLCHPSIEPFSPFENKNPVGPKWPTAIYFAALETIYLKSEPVLETPSGRS